MLCVLQNGSVGLVKVHEVGVVLSNVKEHVRKYFSPGLHNWVEFWEFILIVLPNYLFVPQGEFLRHHMQL